MVNYNSHIFTAIKSGVILSWQELYCGLDKDAPTFISNVYMCCNVFAFYAFFVFCASVSPGVQQIRYFRLEIPFRKLIKSGFAQCLFCCRQKKLGVIIADLKIPVTMDQKVDVELEAYIKLIIFENKFTKHTYSYATTYQSYIKPNLFCINILLNVKCVT